MIDSTPSFLRRSGTPFLLGLLLAGGLGCSDSFEVVESTLPPEVTPPAVTPTPTPWLEKHLSTDPDFLDFGPVPLRCKDVKEVRVFNDSIQDVLIFGIASGVDTTSEFEVTTFSNITLASFDSLTIPIAYIPEDQGVDNGALLIQSDAASVPNISIGLSGQDGGGGERTETFIQPPGTPVDFIWLLDISGSMADSTEQVVENFDDFMQELEPLAIDYQMALLTTSMDFEGTFIGTYGADESSRWITTEMGAESIEEFTNNMILVSKGSFADERGLDSLQASISDQKLSSLHSGFIRDEARLMVTVFSDEDDHSLTSTGAVVQRLEDIKPNLDIVFSAIVGLEDGAGGTCQPEFDDDCYVDPSLCYEERGSQYIAIADHFDGVQDDVCASSYRDLMETLGEYSASAQSIFPLEGTPELTYDIIVSVTVEGESPYIAKESTWFYLPESNAIQFAEAAVPPAGSSIEISFVEGAACL